MAIYVRKGTAEDGGFILKKGIHVTKRELEALMLVGSGLNNGKVAERLGVRVNTVRNHIWNVMQKLEAESRAHAIVLAVENGIIEIKKEGSMDTYGSGSGKYLLCIFCGRADLADNYREGETKKVIINHVEYEIDNVPRCPNKECKGNLGDTLYWDEVRRHHPEYPEIPEHGVVYDYDIEWFRGY